MRRVEIVSGRSLGVRLCRDAVSCRHSSLPIELRYQYSGGLLDIIERTNGSSSKSHLSNISLISLQQRIYIVADASHTDESNHRAFSATSRLQMLKLMLLRHISKLFD
jgi:hypothetical protein